MTAGFHVAVSKPLILGALVIGGLLAFGHPVLKVLSGISFLVFASLVARLRVELFENGVKYSEVDRIERPRTVVKVQVREQIQSHMGHD